MLLDSSRDGTGFKPNTADNLKCADGAAKNVAKLVKDLLTCHRKKAAGDRKAKFFDVDACDVKGKSKYDGRGGKLTGAGICPSCLDSTAQGVRRDLVALQLDASPQVFLCATTTAWSTVTTTSTSVTSSTSTSSTSTSSSSTSSTNTTSTSIITTSSTSSTSTLSTSASSTSTSATTSTVTTTALAFTQYKLTLTTSTTGTSFCGSAGFGTPPSAPFGGQLNDAGR